MAAYQQGGNAANVEDIANRILKLDPKHVRALAVVTPLERRRATQGQADGRPGCVTTQSLDFGLKALPGWKKPEGVDDATNRTLRDHMAAIFNGAAGFTALQEGRR